jgi:hypothetical protein
MKKWIAAIAGVAGIGAAALGIILFRRNRR